MNETYGHHISRHIQKVYCRRMGAPALYLAFLIALWLTLPLQEILFPLPLQSPDGLNAYQSQHASYVEADFSDLYFTGYTNTSFGQTTGYYYYAITEPNAGSKEDSPKPKNTAPAAEFPDSNTGKPEGNSTAKNRSNPKGISDSGTGRPVDNSQQCTIVLLSPSTCEEGLPFIESVHIRGRVLAGNQAFQALLENLSKDLNWTKQGISQTVSSYFVSEPAFLLGPSVVFLALYFSTGIYALLCLARGILYLRFPVLAPPCRQLGRYGKPRELLTQAETELATLPQLATEDMFITEHYFIVLANYGAAIIPIQEIAWIYKHSTLHKFLWYHFSISYTLHVTANKHLYFQCPKNMKSDIDGIIDYLSEANHDILVGFNEENRRKVHGQRPCPAQLGRVAEFLQKRLKLR